MLWVVTRHVSVLVSYFLSRGDSAGARRVLQWAATFFVQFCFIAPCPFCRPSSQTFTRELLHAEPRIAATLRGLDLHTEAGLETGLSALFGLDDGMRALRFVFDLRNKVNMKLQAQHMHDASAAGSVHGVAFSGKSCSVPPRGIKFGTFVDRLMLRRVWFGVDDLLIVLNALRLDHQPPLGHHYRRWLGALCQLVKLECRARRLDRCHPLRMFCDMLDPSLKLASAETLASPAGFEGWLLQLMHGIAGRPAPKTEAEREKSREWAFGRFDTMVKNLRCAKETCASP